MDTGRSQSSGTVVPDGSLRLTMYYKRKTCQLSFFRWDGTVFEKTDGFVLPEDPVLRVMKGERYEISLGLENK